MPTAPTAVRAAARYLAPPVGDEGVAQLIEQLVLASPETAARNAHLLATAHAQHADEVAAGSRVGDALDAPNVERTATNLAPEADRAPIGAPRA
jgi:hypothetical protein